MRFIFKIICLAFLLISLLNTRSKGALVSGTFSQSEAEAANSDLPASVLTAGEWYRFPIHKRGIYKITIEELKNAGVNIAALDPKKISIHGYGNGMLPQANSADRPQDLPEIPIFISGESDGKFDQNDYILFYAEGSDFIEFDETDGKFSIEKNLYADSSFYFLTTSNSSVKRIEKKPSGGINTSKVRSYKDFIFHEKDLNNILSSGREWYGERFTAGSSVKLEFDLPGLVSGSPTTVEVKVMSSNASPSTFSITANNKHLGDIEVEPIPRVNQTTGLNTYAIKGKENQKLFVEDFDLPSNNLFSVGVTFNGTANDGFAYLDKLLIQAEKTLTYRGTPFIFNNAIGLTTSPITFELENATSRELVFWDVTTPSLPQIQEAFKVGTGYLFGDAALEFKEYAVFDLNATPAPVNIKKVENQNIKGVLDAEMLIVSYPDFLNEAKRLAAFRESYDGIKVNVVTPSQIYNEFSSGRQDVTAIRDYVKYLYDNGNIKYLLLFGKCSYAYKEISFQNTNFIPTYQSYNSLHPVETYSSDDYFGFLNDEEGLWPENISPGDHLLDIGIGRLPVKTPEEAKVVVDKIIHYQTSPETYGPWRNEIVFVADDEDNNTHQKDAESLANMIDTAYTAYHVNKIFLGAFPQEGNTSEATKAALNDAVKKGALIINYSGHGNESVWTKERILTTTMIDQWQNFDKLSFFVTATCEFGKYDNPLQISGGELLLLNPKGGAIGLLTTSRPVYSNTNFLLNSALYEVIFSKAESENLTLGEIIKSTKNNSLSGYRNRNFSLLGDPSLRLAFPKKEIKITDISSDQIDNGFDTLRSSAKIRISGQILSGNKMVDSDFNGIANVAIYDKPLTLETLAANGTTMSYRDQNKVLFRGKVSIFSGEFEIEFIVPKNINYNFGKGKLGIYAYSASNKEDAHAGFTEIVIGGSGQPLSDNNPPLITLYMDDESFQPGDITGSNTLLLAKLEDESGINITSSSLDQNLSATINKGRDMLLNDFFEYEINSYQQGWVTYPINNLENGNYTLNLKAWDINSNFSQKSLHFIVASDEHIALSSVMNFPNPFYSETTFSINHNRAGDDLEISIQIFSMKGNLVKEIYNTYKSSLARIEDIVWDGTSSTGLKLSQGIYTYKVVVRSLADQSKMQEFQRLVLIN